MSRNSIWCGFLRSASWTLPINIMLAFPICSDARKTSTSGLYLFSSPSLSLSLSILMTIGVLPVHNQYAVVFDIAHCCLRTFCMLGRWPTPRAAIIYCQATALPASQYPAWHSLSIAPNNGDFIEFHATKSKSCLRELLQ